MIIPQARNQTPSSPNERRKLENNRADASLDDPTGREEDTDRDSSDSSKLSNGHFAHADTDARKVMAFHHQADGV